MTDDLIRDFKGIWIPKDIWLDERLNTIDKIVLLEIDSLDTSEEGCFASNKYLADFCKCTETTISTSISKLIKLKYLEVIKFDGRKRYVKSRLSKIERQTLNNLKADFKKLKDINIDNNIDNNIDYNKKEIYKERFKPPTLEEIKDYCLNVRHNDVNYQKFYDYYTTGKWKDKDGKPIKNWKQKIITWEGRNKKEIEVPKWFEQDNKIQKTTKTDEKELEELLNEIGVN